MFFVTVVFGKTEVGMVINLERCGFVGGEAHFRRMGKWNGRKKGRVSSGYKSDLKVDPYLLIKAQAPDVPSQKTNCEL